MLLFKRALQFFHRNNILKYGQYCLKCYAELLIVEQADRLVTAI